MSDGPRPATPEEMQALLDEYEAEIGSVPAEAVERIALSPAALAYFHLHELGDTASKMAELLGEGAVEMVVTRVEELRASVERVVELSDDEAVEAALWQDFAWWLLKRVDAGEPT